MKTIKIFLASSEELENDRNAFGNLIRRLNKTYEKRGIHLDLFEWEDYDAAYNNMRKQDEYNDEVRSSDMFLAVFHRVAGRFTIEEFDIAMEESRKKSLPKTFVYCKDLQEDEVESTELKDFKQRLIDEMGHYWSRYSNKDTMQLHFVMQLQLVESSTNEALKVEDGNIMFDGERIAHMNNVPFAALNEDYLKMSNRLEELKGKIEETRLRIEQYPALEEVFKGDLQKFLDEYNKLKNDFADHQKNLFDTSKRVAQMQQHRISARMRRAMDAFEQGDVRKANIILDEVEADSKAVLEEFLRSQEITEQMRLNVFTSIDELLLKCSTVMSDPSIPIDERVDKVSSLYAQADDMAQKANYDGSKHIDLLTKITM